MAFNIGIDGPAGAGKSTIARKVAAKLGFIYVDTGAMYRAMALFMLKKKVNLNDTKAIEEICEEADISIKYENGLQSVYLNGENVNDSIRTPEVSAAASKTSVVKKVREKLVSLQQALAAETSVVMDGRDICTKVLPDADVKVYLTASVEVRAKRRFDELKEKGENCDIEEIKKDIAERDHRDMTREESPLVKASDAVEIDSSDMTIDEVTEKILSLC